MAHSTTEQAGGRRSAFAGVAMTLVVVAASACAGAPAARPAVELPAVTPEPAPRLDPRLERIAVDTAGATADCVTIDAPSARAWCGLWAEAPTVVLDAVEEAMPEAASARRRAELLLLRAIASGEEGDAREAQQVIVGAKLSPYGEAHDPDAGDLPYLLARAQQAGHAVEIAAPDGDASYLPDPARMATIARTLYRSAGRAEAEAHGARLQAACAIDAGAMGQAIEALDAALAADLRQSNPSGLEASFALASRLAAELRAPALRRLARADAAIVLEDEIIAGVASWPSEAPKALSRTSAGRRRLTSTIRGLRASSDALFNLPPNLLDALRSEAVLARLGPGDYELAFEAGMLLRERGARLWSGRYLRVAIEGIEATRASLPAPTLRQLFLADKRDVYFALVDHDVAIHLEDRPRAAYEQALSVANRLKARGLLDLFDGAIVAEQTVAKPRPRDLDAATPSARARAIREMIARWTEAAGATETRSDFEGLLSWAEEALPEDTALVEYVLGPRRSYVWVERAGEASLRRLAGREQLEPMVDAYLDSLHGGDPIERRRLAERLYVALVGPIQDLVTPAKRLIIAPDARLYDLPFEALVRPTRARHARYLLEDFAIGYAPSTAVLRRLMERPPALGAGPPLLLGDPNVEGPGLSLLPLARQLPDDGLFALRALFPPLPGARLEVSRVGRVLDDADARVGEAATEDALLGAGEARLIHVAAHGLSDARTVGPARGDLDLLQPALLLGRAPDSPRDGVLTLEEILRLPIAARLVVLSGCATGTGWRSLGEGAYGLAGAFLFAGAQHVVGSRWPLADRVTSRLMTSFYRALSSGGDPAHALRRAKLDLLRRRRAEGADPSPFLWAGMLVLGPA